MERVAIAGLSLHQADVAALEHVKRGLARLEAPAVKTLADGLGASEAALLSTCNRVELVFARESGHAPGPADLRHIARALGLEPELGARFFLHAGPAAVRHLLRVSASLDSLVLGEDQILAQVRAAESEARALGLSGRLLGALFEQAAQLGKEVRSSTDLSRHPVSVVSLGVAFLTARLAAVPAARIAVLGAGATGAHAARALCAAGRPPTFVVNRGAARAHALAEEVGARTLTLEALRAGAEPVDALVAATSAPAALLDAAALRRLAARAPHGRLYAVDLAVPRDLEPLDDSRLETIDLEALRALSEENRQRRALAAAEAERMVEAKLARLFRERAGEAATGSFAVVAAEAREAFELELARLCEGRLAHLAPPDRLAVERWARRAFGRIGHVPFRALKRLARSDALPRGEWEGLE
jgi:glutamyl-tRNA reductase